jgi:adenosylcobinamide hydrolase
MFETVITDEILQLQRPETRWLSTGWDGGIEVADAAYNVSVPEGWERTDLDAYTATRLRRAGFDAGGPALLTGVEMRHARGAKYGPVTVFATVGLSNPAALPLKPRTEVRSKDADESAQSDAVSMQETGHTGTVNLLVGSKCALDDGALANLLTVVAEAKTATLTALADVPGTTTDAVIVASDQAGEPATFTGSATAVGSATRACVRDAIYASFRSRYAEEDPPASVADAAHGVVTDQSADVFRP